ncbi:MAG: adenine phosphoribosyltransferase [Alphaproteobacteria bacterium]|nr:adenine phosphoribosyltransferase [Alphaproteobacteria bacterium]
MYINARSFNAILDDLVAPFDRGEFDVVAGPDAMGFVLGAAIAARFGKGFLTIRKAGKMPVDVDVAEFSNYTGRSGSMELRKPAFHPGTRVLLVDQWIETGGTMAAAIDLVERQGGIVAGIATVCLQETHGAQALREKYKCSTLVLPGTTLQDQIDSGRPDFFDDFDWECYLPDRSET